jgi:alpha-glucosidase
MVLSQQPWWRGAVLYQIYPRSFADSNGDGVGDLNGLRGRLDYLESLGVDGVWLTPTFPSPNHDWGYDVSDYYDVHPDLGTLDDLDAVVREAGDRGIRVLLDLVPAHSSDEHEWFVESRASHESPKRSWYIWRNEDSAQESVFGGRAWTYDERTGQYYHHRFLAQQPDLNWLNPEVRDAFDDILRFWFDRGISGFRIDVVHELVKDPPDQANLPEIHEVLRRWRKLAESYDSERILLGETWVMELEKLATFYGTGSDELHMAFNFPFAFAGLDADALADIVDNSTRLMPGNAWPVWTLSNHDIARFPTRLCNGDEAKVRCALLLLLALRGTPVLYYGDELGMQQVEIPPDRVLDVHGRDGARTPMPWGDVEWNNPWLPAGTATPSVSEQTGDPTSVLSFCRELVALRRVHDALVTAPYARLDTPPGAWAWRRGDSTVVAVNLSDDETQLDLSGEVLLSTAGRTDPRSLGPWEGLVLETRE